jgi:hypothetical protein
MKNYYAFRTDRNHRDFMFSEIQAGRLRQGWGFDPGQNLLNWTVDQGSKANLKMLNVKRGDLILVPGLPEQHLVILVRATGDWEEDYRFEIDPERADYGHIFPVKIERIFARHNELVHADIRKTLRTPSRFWNVNSYADAIENLLQHSDDKLGSTIDATDKFGAAVGGAYEDSFDREKFVVGLRSRMTATHQSGEWEYALVAGLQELFPMYQVERTGGRAEKEHGTDILIRMPSLLSGETFGIAIQIKDYYDQTDLRAIDQISKADNWEGNDSIRIIEKVVIYTNVKEADHQQLKDNQQGVRVLFAKQFDELLGRMGEAFVQNGRIDG